MDNQNEPQGAVDTGGATMENRDWLQKAIEQAGGTITDSGAGCGGFDLGYSVNGEQFSVSVSRRESSESTEQDTSASVAQSAQAAA